MRHLVFNAQGSRTGIDAIGYTVSFNEPGAAKEQGQRLSSLTLQLCTPKTH